MALVHNFLELFNDYYLFDSNFLYRRYNWLYDLIFYTFNIYVLFYATCNLIKSLLPLISGEYYHVNSFRTLVSNAKQCKKHCVPTCKCMLILLDHDSTNNDFLAHEKSLFYNACDCHVRYFYNLFIQ